MFAPSPDTVTTTALNRLGFFVFGPEDFAVTGSDYRGKSSRKMLYYSGCKVPLAYPVGPSTRPRDFAITKLRRSADSVSKLQDVDNGLGAVVLSFRQENYPISTLFS